MLLWEVMTWQRALSRVGRVFAELVNLPVDHNSISNHEEEQLSIHERLVLGLRRAWENLQRFYINHAKIILCTASTAGRKSLRYYKPTFVIVEEASQMTESVCLNGIIRSYATSKKVIMSGDVAQRPRTVCSVGRNECFESEKMSLFERLLKSGHPAVQLQVQHRMNPEIADFVSREFYEDKLITHSSCRNRQTAQKFRNFMAAKIPNCSPGASYFISVEGSSVWRRRGQSSLFNAEYISSITGLVRELIEKGCPQQCILVLSYYREKRLILSQLLHGFYQYKDILVQSVDASQGSERDIVLLSTCRPGRGFGLGFVADRQRQCVAMSRARDGLVIFGDERMGDGNKASGFRSWKAAIDHHRQQGRLHRITGSHRLLEEALGIPNDKDFVAMAKKSE